jgi:hypothetical protein
MAVLDINWHPTSSQLRQFAVLQLVFFGLAAVWLDHRIGSRAATLGVLSLSALACLIGLIRPQTLRWFFVGWIVAVFPIGWCVSHLLLAVIFYLVFAPIGIIMAWCGYDPMHRRWDRQAKTYWLTRTPPDDIQRYFKQY